MMAQGNSPAAYPAVKVRLTPHLGASVTLPAAILNIAA